MHNGKATGSMHNRLLICAVLVASSLGVTPLFAQGPAVAPPAPPAPAPPAAPAPAVTVGNSQDNFQGDRVTFPVNMTATISDGSGDANDGKAGQCLPAGTTLRGVGQDTNGVHFVIISCTLKVNCQKRCDGSAIRDGSSITMTLADIAKYPPDRNGLAYGGLVVPFKFQLTGAHQFTSSATVGPYLGYRMDRETVGAAVTFAAFAGASNIAVTKGGSTQQLAGFGYGIAVLGEIKGGFQLGGVLGFDSVGSNQGFQYNNKPWLALELGYSFSQ
jgi:hypothetical protein